MKKLTAIFVWLVVVTLTGCGGVRRMHNVYVHAPRPTIAVAKHPAALPGPGAVHVPHR
jgi:hypothetical protein